MVKWTADEMRLVRSIYPTRGIAGVRAELPHRSPFSIKGVAARLGVECCAEYIKEIQRARSLKGAAIRSGDNGEAEELRLREEFNAWQRIAPVYSAAPVAWRLCHD